MGRSKLGRLVNKAYGTCVAGPGCLVDSAASRELTSFVIQERPTQQLFSGDLQTS